MESNKNFKVSVILNTYNWPEALNLVLISLVSQAVKNPNVEIIIADDGSSDDTKTIISKYIDIIPGRLKHIWHEDNGFRRSMILNKAVAASGGDYLLFLDGDCITFPDYLAEHIKLMEPGFFVAGNRVLLSKEFSQAIFENHRILDQIFSWGFLGWLSAKFNKKVNKLLAWLRINSGKWRYLRGGDWKYPKGCNIGVWRNDYLAVNGFDESFTGWGHEDSDLFVRLLHGGVRIKNGRFAVPVLHIWHKEADRTKASANWSRLMTRVNDTSFIKAVSGVDQYIK